MKRVVYVPKEKAIAAERKAGRGAYYDLLGANPLPDTFRIYPDKPDNISKIRNALAPLSPSGGRTVIDPSIDEVRNREEDTNKILSATRVVKITMALLAVLLCVASILLIANTIRLSLYARRREVEVMKLVGATDWFIRWPFVLEGVLVGALGGILAILLLGVVKVALVDPLAAQFALIAAPDTINFGLLIARPARRRRSPSRRSARACRCAASCASELLGSPKYPAVPCSPCPPQVRADAGRTSCRSARSSCCSCSRAGSGSAATRTTCRTRCATRWSATTTPSSTPRRPTSSRRTTTARSTASSSSTRRWARRSSRSTTASPTTSTRRPTRRSTRRPRASSRASA